MPFCGVYIANYYPPCVPRTQQLPPDQNFPDGRHSDHTTRAKDRWVETTFLEKARSNAFRRKRDCQEAYKRYLCWANFPRCDEEERSLPVCSSVCQNMLRACGSTDKMNTLCSTSDVVFFPGEPFLPNKFVSRGEPAPVCTPSIKNVAQALTPSSPWVVAFLMTTASTFMLFV